MLRVEGGGSNVKWLPVPDVVVADVELVNVGALPDHGSAQAASHPVVEATLCQVKAA